MIFNSSPFPILHTQRLILRSIHINDAESVFYLRTNKEVNKFITRNTPEDISEAIDFIKIIEDLIDKNKGILWVISLKETNTLIGTIGLRNFNDAGNYAEIGYELHPNYHQKGIMSEALKAVLKFGFQKMDLKTIEAFTHKNNTPSIALLEKHNFVFQPERIDKGFDNNRIFKLEEN